MNSKKRYNQKVEAVIDELERQAEWLPSVLAKYEPHQKQRLFHRSTKRNRWFIAGNRAGKTEAGAVEAVMFALGRHRFTPQRNIPVPNFGWVVSSDFSSSRDVAEGKIRKYLPESEIDVWNRTDRIVKLRNGSEIGFKSCDSGRDKFQGVTRHWIWFDEEPPEDVYRECFMRTVDVKGEIWGTMTPLKGFTWFYRHIYKNSSDPDIAIFSAALHDNPYIPKEEIERVERNYSEEEKDIRVRGRFVSISGRCVFDTVLLRVSLDGCRDCLTRGFLHMDTISSEGFRPPDLPARSDTRSRPVLEHSKDGPLTIWEPPQNGALYVIGADVSEGLEKGDYSSAQVVRRDTGEQVAEWHGHTDPDLFGIELFKLGRFYNDAFVGVEANGHGLTTLVTLKRYLGYPNVYYRQTVDRETKGSPSRYSRKLGWLTNARTKPLMIDELAGALRDEGVTLSSSETVEEMFTFVRDETGGMGAQEGCYDDRVIALAIALQMLKTAPVMPSPRVGSTTAGRRQALTRNRITGY